MGLTICSFGFQVGVMQAWSQGFGVQVMGGPGPCWCAESALHDAHSRYSCSVTDTHGWLSKLWSPFGSPKYQVPYDTKDPKRDHDFDNHQRNAPKPHSSCFDIYSCHQPPPSLRFLRLGSGSFTLAARKLAADPETKGGKPA